MGTIKDHVQVLRSDQTILPGGEPTYPIPEHAETHEKGGSDQIDGTIEVARVETPIGLIEAWRVTAQNDTGGAVTAGEVVYVNSGSAGNPTFDLVDPSSITKDAIIAVTAEALVDNEVGEVCLWGPLAGLDTSSYSLGDSLWASSTPGALTKTRPAEPDQGVFVGTVIKVDASDGILMVGPEFCENLNLEKIGVYGFEDLTESTLSFNDSTYALTITDAGAGWSYWRNGVRVTISGSKSVTLSGSPPTADQYFFYIDDEAGTLVYTTSPFTFDDTKVPVAIVEWNNANTPKYFLADERHQSTFPRRAHWHHHFTEGTKVISGGGLSGYTVAPASPADTDNTFGIAATQLADEDIKHTLAALVDPDGTGTDYLTYYRTGASAWTWEQSGVPFRYTAAGYIQYDNAGTMTQGQNSKYYNWYLCFTNYGDQPRYLLVPGQSEFANAAAAYAETVSDLDLSGFYPLELVFAYQLTFFTNASYTSKGKCRLTREPRAIDTARISLAFSPGATDHNGLSGLQGGNGTDEYYHLNALVHGYLSDTQYIFPDGLVSAPGLAPASDLNTGFYWDSSGAIRFSSNGVNTMKFGSGLEFIGSRSITSTANGDISLIPNGTGVVKVGSGSPAYASDSGDLFVQDRAEIAGNLYAKGGIYQTEVNALCGHFSAAYGSIRWQSTAQTPDCTLFLTGSNSEIFLMCQNGDAGYDFSHAAELDPTFIIHSRNQSTTEFIKFQHDTNTGLIHSGDALKFTTSGNGDITLAPAGVGSVIVTGADLQLDQSLQLTAGGAITTTSNGDITLAPDGTGNVVVSGANLELDQSLELTAGGSITTTSNGQIYLNPNGTGKVYASSNSGVESFSLDGSTGIHSFPVTSRTAAYSDAGTQTIPSGGSGATVIFEHETKDQAGEYDHTTGVFTATIGGVYLATWSAAFADTAWTAGNIGFSWISLNGSTSLTSAINKRGNLFDCPASANFTVNSLGSATYELSASDTLEIKLYQNTGGALTVHASPQYNWFNVTKIA